MKKISLLLLALFLVFASCDLSSPDRSSIGDMPTDLEGKWLGVIYNAKSDGWAIAEMASTATVDFDSPVTTVKDQTYVEDGVLGVEVVSDSVELFEVLADIDDSINGFETVKATQVLAELRSDNPDVGYMITGDLTLGTVTKYDEDNNLMAGYPKAQDVVSGTVHLPGYTDSSVLEGPLKDEIYNLLESTAKNQSALDEIFDGANMLFRGAAVFNGASVEMTDAVVAGADQSAVVTMMIAALTSDNVDAGGIPGVPDDIEPEFTAAAASAAPADVSGELGAILVAMGTADASFADTDYPYQPSDYPVALKNDLRQAHKDIIDEYIEVEDLFGFIDGDYAEGGLSHTGTDRLQILSLSWGYDEESGDNEIEVTEILCHEDNDDWMTEGFIRLNSIAVGRFMAMAAMDESFMQTDYNGNPLAIAVTGAFGDPRWSEIQDIDE